MTTTPAATSPAPQPPTREPRPNPHDPLADPERHRLQRALVQERVAVALARMEEVGPEAVLQELCLEGLLKEEQCSRAAAAATGLEQLLEGLLESDVVFHHAESVDSLANGQYAICIRTGGALRRVKVHPSVSAERLERLRPGHVVLVNPREMIVVDVEDPALLPRFQKEVVAFARHLDRAAGLALVERSGRGREVVHLAPPLYDGDFVEGDLLVTAQDAEHWAIGRIDDTDRHTSSRYEVDVETIPTRFADLAGLDELAEEVLEDVLARVAFPETRDRFALDKLSGMLLQSRPGTGKTAFSMALARELYEVGRRRGFVVRLLHVPPNSFKSMWHGKDAENVREFGRTIEAIFAAHPHEPVLVLNLFDEVDSLGSRSSGGREVVSSAQNDVVQALLECMDGIVAKSRAHDHGHQLLFLGLTNFLEGVDPALRRPDRFGNDVRTMPDVSFEMAEGILWVNLRHPELPVYVDGTVQCGLGEERTREALVRPALHAIFDQPVLNYTTEGQRRIAVTGGQLLTGANFKNAACKAKRRAACRELRGTGTPAVAVDDLADQLVREATAIARQYETDRRTLRRDLRIDVPIATVELVPEEQLRRHRFVRIDG
jgi:SpoVK/Ycf46/Vps4 family AAA+-type ATPase